MHLYTHCTQITQSCYNNALVTLMKDGDPKVQISHCGFPGLVSCTSVGDENVLPHTWLLLLMSQADGKPGLQAGCLGPCKQNEPSAEDTEHWREKSSKEFL